MPSSLFSSILRNSHLDTQEGHATKIGKLIGNEVSCPIDYHTLLAFAALMLYKMPLLAY